MRVSIDVDATRGVVDGLRALVERIFDEWADAGRAAREALASTGPLQRLDDPVLTIARLATELSLRVDLAVRVNTDGAGHCPTGRPLEYEVTDDTLDGVKTALGSALARAIQDVNSTDDEGARQLHAIAESLGPYATDPDVMSGFWAAAGPDWAELLPSFLAATGSDTARADLEAFSQSFCRALQDEDPPEAFVELAERYLTPPDNPGTAWNRLAMLQFGPVPTAFLDQAARANALDILRDPDQAGRWDFRGGFSEAMAFGLPEDTLALAFDALARDDEAARLAISAGNGTPEMVHLVYGYAEAYGSGDEVADAFGRAVEAGAGVHDEAMGRHSPEASLFAFEVLTASAAHEDLPFDRHRGSGPVISAPTPGSDVPWVVKNSLAALVASYAPEMLAGAVQAEHGTRFSSMNAPADWTGVAGLQPAFHLSTVDTYALLQTLAGEEGFLDSLDAAAGELYGDLLGQAVRADARDGTYTVLDTAALFGNLAGLEYAAAEHILGQMDAFDTKVREMTASLLSAGLDKIPTPQTQAVAWALKGLVFGTKQGLSAWRKGDSEATRVALLDDETLQASFLYEVELTGILIENDPSRADALPPALRSPSGGLIAADAILETPGALAAFEDWLDTQDGPEDDRSTDRMVERTTAVFRGGVDATEDFVRSMQSHP